MCSTNSYGHLLHGCIHFPKKPGRKLTNFRHRKRGDTMQVPCWGITNIRRRGTRSSRQGDLVTGICVPLIYLFVFLCPQNIFMCSVLTSAAQWDCFIKRLVFILEVGCVHCAVRTESLSIVNVECSLQRVNKECPNKSARFNFLTKRIIYSKSVDIFISV